MTSERERAAERMRRRTSQYLNRPDIRATIQSNTPAAVVYGKAWCRCRWERLDDRFKRCRDCGVLMVYRPSEPRLETYQQLTNTHVLPRVVGDYVRIQVIDRLLVLQWSANERFCRFLVRFPKRWELTNVFTAETWPAVIEKLRPVLAKEKFRHASAIYYAAQMAIVGKEWAELTLKEVMDEHQ